MSFRTATLSSAVLRLALAAGALSLLVHCARTGSEQTHQVLAQPDSETRRQEATRTIQEATDALRENPELPEAYYMRGRELLLLGRFQEAVADLDKYVQLRPGAESQQWERGIAYYYVGQYADGARQFALYQDFDGTDVENAFWHFLCLARSQGVEEARKQLLPVQNDPRVPLMQVYDMIAGKASPDDVLQAARAGDVPANLRAARLFYAHLYIGLYHDALGEQQLAAQHLAEATKELPADAPASLYMWDIARLHARQLEEKKEADAAKTSGDQQRPEP